MKLLQNLDWDDWVLGMWTALGTGASNAALSGLGLNVIDPKDFNIYTSRFWMALLAFFILGGLKDFLLFINKNPAPKRTNINTSITTEPDGKTEMKQIVQVTEAIPGPKKE